MSLPPSLTSPPPTIPNVDLTFPAPHVLLITLNRPSSLNAIPSTHHPLFDALYRWYDAQPSLRVAILTGTGRAFCAGADLKEWDSRHSAGEKRPEQTWTGAGFGGLSNRTGKKPVIAAVNGLCLGGGMEMVINCDLVLADKKAARFALPEVKRGVVAVAGALPRLIRTVGRQRAGEMSLLGRMYSAEEIERWGVVNFLTDEGKVVEEAVKVASELAGNSPDAVIVSREGLRVGWEGVGPVTGTGMLEMGWYGRIDGGENMAEGVRAFVEKRGPVWRDSKL